MISFNLANKSLEERSSIERDRIAALWAHNIKKFSNGQKKVTERLNKLSKEQREDMQQRVDKYLMPIHRLSRRG